MLKVGRADATFSYLIISYERIKKRLSSTPHQNNWEKHEFWLVYRSSNNRGSLKIKFYLVGGGRGENVSRAGLLHDTGGYGQFRYQVNWWFQTSSQRTFNDSIQSKWKSAMWKMRRSYEQDRQRGNFECTNPCQEKPPLIKFRQLYYKVHD